MNIRLQKHLNLLKQLDYERRQWLKLSAFVVAVVLAIIIRWNDVVDYHLTWVIVSCGLSITVVWWYWTMKIVRHLIDAKCDEYSLLTEIITEVQSIKADVKDSFKPIDKS